MRHERDTGEHEKKAFFTWWGIKTKIKKKKIKEQKKKWYDL